MLIALMAVGAFAQSVPQNSARGSGRYDPNPGSDFDFRNGVIWGFSGPGGSFKNSFNDGPSGGRIVIPTEINGIPVTSIKDDAFRNQPITQLVILHRIMIGNSAFERCPITDIRFEAFPLSIGTGVFAHTQLANFTRNCLPERIPSKIPDRLFSGTDRLRGELIIPEGITEIGTRAFANTAITSVTLPRTIRTIGEEAFAGCNQLTTVTIPSSVTSIIFRNHSFGGSSNRAPLNAASIQALQARGASGNNF